VPGIAPLLNSPLLVSVFPDKRPEPSTSSSLLAESSCVWTTVSWSKMRIFVSEGSEQAYVAETSVLGLGISR
jgi:hypothetical protein